MKDSVPSTAPEKIYLKDYRAPAFWVDEVHLTFRLAPTATRVLSRITFRPNPDAPGPFFLHGEELTLISAKIDGKEITPEHVKGGITAPAPDAPFVWEAEVEISPETNTALEGLYMSNGMYCTQCEAEGFRKITYYPDRPDVMAPFTVRVESDLPVLLSNGNPGKTGPGFAEWHDPWPKPAYLFALVAGELIAHPDSFTTASGREVALNIWVRPGDEDKCAFGMDALKRSMVWDERVYGREYDLDIFNIVAVDDFNMGAMENKGLNIFNSSAVLCSPETSTDGNFERIEAIIAHEYFHNWTGNRITCRDWFQLCLKEGLTVFRDQQFTADERSAAVARINDVVMLRARQFREDNGPLAHPVRPESFVEINNFYTATVYEKGAEVIRMLRTLVGEGSYAEALDLYFTRHDGQACTIEDWIAVFEEVTGRDLSQFKLWYSQAGTPRLTVRDRFENGRYTLDLAQETPPTPGGDVKEPVVIPLAFGLIGPDGSVVHGTQVYELSTAIDQIVIEGLAERPTPSLLRGFSAPVILDYPMAPEARAHLLAHDTDAFARWEAGRSLAKDGLIAMITDGVAPDGRYLDAIATALRDDATDPALRAQLLGLPSEDDLAQTLFDGGVTPDPDAIHEAVETLRQARAETLQDTATRLYAAHQVDAPFAPTAEQAGHRALANACLGLLSRVDGGAAAARQFETADNMTQSMSALSQLVMLDRAEDALAAFFDRWAHERLVIDKWFGVQTSLAAPERAVEATQALTQHPEFSVKNPNRFRAVFGGFAGNTAGFHARDGSGYDLMSDWLQTLDALNPQVAARMCAVFETWRRYDADRQAAMRDALSRIGAREGVSRDVSEMVTRMLA